MAFAVVAEPPDRLRRLGRPREPARAPAADARSAARTAGASRLGVRLLPHDRRHQRERRRSAPTSRTSPVAPVDRRRRRSEHARQPRGLDPRPAAAEAGQPDAGHRPQRRRSCRTLLAYLESAAVTVVDATRALRRTWDEPAGVVLVARDRRPQADRHRATSSTAFVFFLARRARGGCSCGRSWRGPDERLLSPEAYDQLFTMHGTDDDLPLRHADALRLRQLLRPAR